MMLVSKKPVVTKLAEILDAAMAQTLMVLENIKIIYAQLQKSERRQVYFVFFIAGVGGLLETAVVVEPEVTEPEGYLSWLFQLSGFTDSSHFLILLGCIVF